MFLNRGKNREIISNLAVYGIAHAFIDATCAAIAFALLALKAVSQEYFITLVVIYNVIAFGSQPLFGLLTDKYKIPKLAAITGAVITAIAAFIAFQNPLSAAIIAGLGNALFHVGGGTICLNLTRKKAAAPGIFVAPGAIGILIGTLIGKSGNFIAWPIIAITAGLSILIYKTRQPEIDYRRDRRINPNYFELTILLVLLAVVARSLIGSAIALPWKSNLALLIILTAGVSLGKALGGILGDKFGWTRTAVSSLAISAPLLAFGANNPCLAIIGMFLFNFTMPITLTAIANIIPGRPGFSFGLTTLALIIGVLPTYTPMKAFFSNNLSVLIAIIFSTIILFFGLKLYSLKQKTQQKWL